jgi:hypothetical protein
MTNPEEDLSTGIQPFILAQAMGTERQQAHQALIHIYDTVMGGATATITDAQFLVVANDPLEETIKCNRKYTAQVI